MLSQIDRVNKLIDKVQKGIDIRKDMMLLDESGKVYLDYTFNLEDTNVNIQKEYKPDSVLYKDTNKIILSNGLTILYRNGIFKLRYRNKNIKLVHITENNNIARYITKEIEYLGLNIGLSEVTINNLRELINSWVL